MRLKFKNPLQLKQGLSVNSGVLSGLKYTPNVTGRPNFYEWDVYRAISQGYKASTWVYVAVNRISRAAASVDWLAFHKNSDGSKGDRWPDHPFEILMREPNPFTNGQDWRERMYQHLWLSGNCVSRIVSMRTVPVALVQMMPTAVRPVPDDKLYLAGYDLYEQYGGKTGHLKNEEVLHLMFSDPSNMYWGISPLQAVARTVDTDNEAVKWNKVSLQNRAVSDGVFSVNMPITKEEYDDLRSQVREQAQGYDNAHNPWVLGYGTDWKQMSLTPIEMDFLESRKNNRTEILAVYGMPPPMAGIYDQATYDNVASARLIWWLDTILPFLDDVKIALEFGIGKKFGTDFIIDYDISNIEALKALQLQKISSAKELWTMGVPLNTINRTLDLGLPDDIPGADVGYLPLSLYPTTESNPGSTLALPSGTSSSGKGRFKQLARSSMLDTREKRAEYYKAFDRTRLPWERKLKSLADTQLRSDFETLADAFEQDGESGVNAQNLKLRVKWQKMLYQFSATLVKEVGTVFFNELVGSDNSDTGKSLKQTEEFLWDDPEILDALENWSVLRGGRIVDTTMSTVLDMIAASAAEGVNISEIARSVRDLSSTSTYHATLISRTEVVGYHNYAHQSAAKQSDIIDTKMWVSSGDDRVRDSHMEVDGTEVALNETFTVGGSELDFPGDPNGDASEVIQCRCAVAYGQTGKSVRIPKTVMVPESLVYLNGH